MRTAFYIVDTQCDICGDVGRQKHTIPEYGLLPIVALPQEWKEIDGKHICPKHKVSIRVDGKAV